MARAMCWPSPGKHASASGEEYFFVDTPVNNPQVAGLRLAGSLGPDVCACGGMFDRVAGDFSCGLGVCCGFRYWFLKSLSDRTTRPGDYAGHLFDSTLAAPSLTSENDALGVLRSRCSGPPLGSENWWGRAS